MRSFFVKIFLWFWLAMILVCISAVVATVTIQPNGALDHWRRAALSTLHVAAVGAVTAYEHGGPKEVDGYLRRLDADTGVSAYLFDRSGHELSVLNAPPAALHAARRAAHVWQFRDDTLITTQVQPITGARGRYLLVAVEHVTVPVHNRLALLRFGIVMLTGGLICAWLARNITSPIWDLRRTARRLAAGELSARVPATVIRRHDEIAQLGRDFNSMAAHLEALIAAQHRLIADISHELRSPLARLGVASALARRAAGDSATPALDRIEQEAGRLDELIGQLTILSRLESGAADRTPQKIDLTELARGVVADADFEAREQGKFVRMEAETPATILGDPELMRRALENVVRNAVRYTERGTVVVVEVATQKGGATVTIRDYGPGVPESALVEIFRPFDRLQDDRGRETGGAGLGLAIADRAVRSHGGEIAARNAPGGGLAVTMRFPTG